MLDRFNKTTLSAFGWYVLINIEWLHQGTGDPYDLKILKFRNFVTHPIYYPLCSGGADCS